MDIRFYLSYDSTITLKSHILFENFQDFTVYETLLWTLLHNVMAHQVIMSSQEDNKQFMDTVASPSYSVSITTLPGEGITNALNFKKTLTMYLLKRSVRTIQ